MNRKILACIGVTAVLGADLYSTYRASGGDVHMNNELHFVVQIFGGDFYTLMLVFLIEAFVLYGLVIYYASKKDIPQTTSYTYKLIKVRRTQNRYFGSVNFYQTIPLFIYIITLGHFIAAINNVFVILHKSNTGGAIGEISNRYINYVHYENRIFLVYLAIVIGAIAISISFFRKNTDSQSQHT